MKIRLEPLALFFLASAASPAFSATADLAALAERTKPSVVLLTIDDATGQKAGTGTGFFISSEGRIVTNHHVIEGAAKVTATLADGSKRAVLGLLADDATRDIAILQAEGESPAPLVLGDSTRVKVGDDIVVIGSPLGLSSTLSVGIVSAVRAQGLAEEIEDAPDLTRSWGMQITAPVSPGSSGSPIMTSSGEVVAVAVGIYSPGRAQNLNFGVPVEVVKDMAARLGPEARWKAFEGASTPNVRRNLLISAGIVGALVLVFVVWGRLEARKQASRPRARRGN